MEPTMSMFASREKCLEARVEYFKTQRDELLDALKEVMAAHRAFPKYPIDCVQKLEGIMERQRKACISADEAIAKAEVLQE